MKEALVFILLLAFIAPSGYSQNVVGGIQGKGLDIQLSPGGFVKQLPPAPPETKGDVYLNSNWEKANMMLYQQTAWLPEYPIRLDLKSNVVEINHNNEVKVLSGGRVKRMRVINSKTGNLDVYVNARDYKLNGTPVIGFFRVIDSAKWELLSKANLKLIEGNYVAALDAGVAANRLVKEELFFFSKSAVLYQAYPSVKKFCRQFGDSGSSLRGFLKSNRINLKESGDLLKVWNT